MKHGIPIKVLSKAHELGVHNDCLIAGPDSSCTECLAKIATSFDFYYEGHTNLEALLSALLQDLDS